MEGVTLPEVERGELEGHRKLIVKLMDYVKKLEEERGEATVLTGVVQIASMVESMAKSHPLFLDQSAEPFKCAVVRVKTELGQA